MKTILKHTAIFCIAVMVLFAAGSCTKEGTGGKSSVSGNVKHHSKLIPFAEVYIKYGATEFPGTNLSSYDAHVTSDANAHYEIKDLQKGDYYLYGVGYDNTIMEAVTGGISTKLKRNKASTTDVPVTE